MANWAVLQSRPSNGHRPVGLLSALVSMTIVSFNVSLLQLLRYERVANKEKEPAVAINY